VEDLGNTYKTSPPQVSSTQTVTVDNGPSQIAALTEKVKELRETVKILISQFQMLRADVRNKK
jgi:ribosomal protein S15P/S13E